jgi:hypothetical protein
MKKRKKYFWEQEPQVSWEERFGAARRAKDQAYCEAAERAIEEEERQKCQTRTNS